jgi:cysteine desulfurase
MARPIYLDNHATTRVDPRVLEATLPSFCESYGNPGSGSHAFGWEAKAAVDLAREQLALLLGAQPQEIVFTSGATESNSLAILAALPADASGLRVLTAATEHHAVLDTSLELRGRGAEVVALPVDEQGLVRMDRLEEELARGAALVSIMSANNETGTLQPVEEIAALCRKAGAVFHSDAAQAVGRVAVDVSSSGVDLLSLSGHKFHALKGVGALYVRSGGAKLRPLQHGGGQERGLRPGTLNVHGIVSLGAAAEISRQELPEESLRIAALRDRLQARLFDELEGLVVNGHPERRLPGNLSVAFEGVESEALMLAMPDLAVSAGSACSSGKTSPSHVLLGMGLSEERAKSTLRFGLGRFTTEYEIDRAGARVVEEVVRLRASATI